MRFMMFMCIPPGMDESEWEPTAEDVAAMGRYNDELRKAGMLLSLDGLSPPADGVRVEFSAEGHSTVTDGPFSEAKEVIGGFSVLDVADLDAAIAIVKTWPMLELPGNSVEIRPMVVDYSHMEQ
jgi:hypothetical protein